MLSYRVAANVPTCTTQHAFCSCSEHSKAARCRPIARAAALAEPPTAPMWQSTRSVEFDSRGRADGQTMGSLHCLWPRYGEKCSLPAGNKAHTAAKEANKRGASRGQLPSVVMRLAGWFTDGPLHCDEQDTAQQHRPSPPQHLTGLASLWRYQGLRL